ncbi:YjiH family protein [Clostridium sp.]|uniref:YjiH family protein n=1 Tax=Clostridium sp. TaxID=1506 RepID=UPI002FCCA172
MENEKNVDVDINKFSIISMLKFILPSIVGIALFMVPFEKDGQTTILVAQLSDYLGGVLEELLPTIILAVILITAIATVLYKVFTPQFITKCEFLYTLLNTSLIWTGIRVLSAVFAVSIYFNIGWEGIYSENTGSLVYDGLLPILFTIFLFAGLFLPLLLNFGLLEFVGGFFTKIMRPLFNLPGRSSIDCMASWLGDGSIGVLLTSKQYEEGQYTQREAAVIGTTFSLVSITFTLVIIKEVGLAHMFIPFYLTVTFASIVAAIIVPKLPPLSRKKDLLINGEKRKEDDDVYKGLNGLKIGYTKAVEKASKQSIINTIFVNGAKNVIDMWFAVIPVVLGVGTIALIIAEYTPVFKILGLPFLPVLYILGIPEAVAASQTLVAGFADMLLPAILSGNISSDLTRFVIACVSVTQLIYLSEVGALILASKIPINLKELFIIFVQRTLVTLPIISIIAHIIF